MIPILSLQRLWAASLAGLLVAGGCMTFESQEERQVRTDRLRMQHGEPLRYHKDTIELSEHAMALRLGQGGVKPAASSAPKIGAGYEFRPSPQAAAYLEQQQQQAPAANGGGRAVLPSASSPAAGDLP